MAKNISKNQWVTSIHADTYVHTAIINNMLLVLVQYVGTETKVLTACKLRHPELFYLTKSISQAPVSDYINVASQGEFFINTSKNDRTYFTVVTLKTKQLETDFYTKEQLAEMYPDDPTYQLAVIDEAKPVAVSNEEESES